MPMDRELKMKIRFSALVLGAMTVAMLTHPQSGHAASKQVTDASACKQALVDIKEQRLNEPEIGDKAAKMFDEIVALAEQRCAKKEFKYANDLLTIARGMVASE